MNLSDEESSSGEESPVPAKRPRTDTLGASSTTSISSVVAESDDEQPELTNPSNGCPMSNVLCSTFDSPKNAGISSKGAGPGENIRLSRSSWSENCSSSNEQDEDFQHGTDDHDNDSEDDARRPQFAGVTEIQSNSDQGNSDGGENVEGGYSDFAKRLMGKMGYKHGKGLGKFEHGRTQPVEAAAQKGRRGLGMKPSIVGAIPQDFKWSPDDSTPVVKEEIIWIPAAKDTLSGDILEDWLKRGPKKLTIADETEFVDPAILKGVLNAKTIFDSLDDEDLRNARFRSNPYETIGAVIFLNRAAVKMANIDAIFDFMFTKPKTEDGKSALDRTDILYFADVCAGPGGFSEYVLFRKKWRAKGFGFTLKGKCDFKLSDFYAGTPETFNPYYGVEDDGNIFNPANLSALKDNVLAETEDKGVHFLMADGGFSVEGQENIQEILSKQLYLCQCLAALMLVRTGGHFVVKLFDLFTPFSVGLLYIMYHSFEHVCIVKPVTSRPANSERYLVCKWKRRDTDATEKHLFSVNAILWSERDGLDISELVPLDVMQNDKEFYEYIYRSNCVIGEKQIKNLLKIAEFSKDKKLKDETQDQMKKHCLTVWQLPNQVRKAAPRLQPDDCLTSILDGIKTRPPEAQSPQSFKGNVLSSQPEYLTTPEQLGVFKSVYDWHFVFLNSGKNSPDLKFFIGCGGRQVYQLDGTRWNLAADLHVTMPAKTLIYAEVVKEYRGQIYNKALHVIDAMMLGGIDVSHLSLTERRTECTRFCSALHKPFDPAAVPLRCKRLLGLERFPGAVADLECRAMKKFRRAVTCAVPARSRSRQDEAFHIVGGVLFLKEIKEPWIAQMSKTHNTKYYFAVVGKDKKRHSEFHMPEAARLNMIQAFSSRLHWPWEPASAVLEGLSHEGLTRVQLENYIHAYINR